MLFVIRRISVVFMIRNETMTHLPTVVWLLILGEVNPMDYSTLRQHLPPS